MANYPTSLDTLSDPGTAEVLGASARAHSVQHKDANDILEALEAKLGIGASAATANTVLRGTGAGTTAFGQVATADLAAAAVTQNGIAVGASGTLSTSSSTYIDMTDMSVTLSTTGGDLLAWFESVCYHSVAAGAISLGIQLDAGAIDAVMTQQPSGVNEIPSALITFTRFTGVSGTPASPVSHTVKGKWSTVTGATANALTNFRRLMVVELKK